MLKSNSKLAIPSLSYWRTFRLTFVVFSLYLLRDAFYRWDGFRFHSTFLEFIPTFALVTTLWSVVAALTALAVWLLLRGVALICQGMRLEIRWELLLLFMETFSMIAIFAIIGKDLIANEPVAFLMKLIILLSVFVVAILLTRKYQNNFDIVSERIAPLVWLFGTCFIVSLPIVVYHTWIKQINNPISQRISHSSLSDTKRPNIILVSFDALTARDMSVYGYNRPTTPFINEWSKTAFLFNRVKSASNWTVPTTASMMTGKRVWTHRMFQEDSKLIKSDKESLPLLLKKNGYYNMAFVVNSYASVKRLGIAAYFDIAPDRFYLSNNLALIGNCCGTLDAIFFRLFNDRIKYYTWSISQDFILGKLLREIYLYPAEVSQTEVPPELAFNKFLETVDNGISGPFFAWIHLVPPHDPYLPGEPYTGMFNSSPKLRTLNKQMVKEVEERKIRNPEDWEIYRARYDEFIRYCDKHFEDFIRELEKRDKLKDAVVILTSDHGESFEHDYFTHLSDHLYEQVTHIPLIIKEPGLTEGLIVNELIEQIDLTPTILSLANIPVPSWMEGRSLLPILRGNGLPSKHIYSMNFQKNPSQGVQITKGTIAVWEDDYKLIHYLEDNKSLLFNLKNDPGELNNLFDEEKEISQRLLALINDNLRKANERTGKEE